MVNQLIERLRLALARHEELAPLTVLGALAGLAAGALMIFFRMSVEWSLSGVLGGDDPEAFESLSTFMRFSLPIAGALLVALVFSRVDPASTDVGIAHIMERLAWFKADLPWRNTVLQFFGALVTMASGHSLGREGPAVHLGAAVSSWLGRALRAPNNSMRTLIACGTAGAIAASFNTPIAGVIFAMEVVLMEYSIAGFTPVIVASVTAAWMSRAVYGPAAAFDVPALEVASLLELPFIVFVGIIIGTLAAFFTRTVSRVKRWTSGQDVTLRFGAAGLLMGICAAAVPEVMGLGYDSLEQALNGELTLTLLLTIAALKLITSAASIGLGMPAGLIAPTLVVGACAGAALGIVGEAAAPELSATPALYALLGMGAMMGATLQAPLAALMAILELTANVNIIAPGMICIVSATVTCKSVFRTESVFITLLRDRGTNYQVDPVAQAFNRLAVSARMRSDFSVVPRILGVDEATRLCSGESIWLVVRESPAQYRALIRSDAVLTLVENLDDPQCETIDLLGMALPRHSTAPITMRATLQEARLAMAESQVETLCVVHESRSGPADLRGILTAREMHA
jgi:CIC family chloride channel protein